MSAKVNLQQKVDRKIYYPFIGSLGADGISIQKGLEIAMKLYLDKKESDKKRIKIKEISGD